MALLLKKIYDSYLYLIDELADPRTNSYPLMQSPIPIAIIVFLWHRFVFKWGPEYMKSRQPLNLRKIIIVYNFCQVLANGYVLFNLLISMHTINWACSPVDYSESYWAKKHLTLAYCYFLIKIADLLDTVFFVLRKKERHVSFLHTYHHFLMAICAWWGTKYFGGGHSYFLGLANCFVHMLLYSYYLVTAYDSNYGKIIWLKKSITQAQLAQFAFLLWCYVRVLFTPDCKYPRGIVYFFIPQNCLMILLFSNFYLNSYILEPRRKKKLEKEAGIKNGDAKVKAN